MPTTLDVPLIVVPFLGNTIYVTDEVEPRVPLRPVVEAMGLSWAAQSVKLSNNGSRWCVSMIETRDTIGRLQKMVAIPLSRLFGWLMSITPSKVSPEVRSTLERFQQECDHVLTQHLTRTRQGLPVPLRPGEQPAGDLLISIYGPSKATSDPEAERLARKVLEARRAGSELRKQEKDAERQMRRLGYDRWEIGLLVGAERRKYFAELRRLQLPLLEG